MNKRKKVFAITIIIFIFIFSLYISFIYILGKETRKNNIALKEKNIKEKWYEPDGNASLIKIYYMEENNSYIFIKENEDKNFIDNKYRYINTYNCSNSNCMAYDNSSNFNNVVIKDENYILYDFNKNKAKNLNLPKAEYNDIAVMSHEGKDYGLAVSNINDMYAFYSLKEKKFTTEFKYSNIFRNETDGISKGYISAVIKENDNIKYYVINYNKNKEIFKSDAYIGIIGNENKLYFYEDYSESNEKKAIIYNDKLESLFNGEQKEIFDVSESGNIVLKDDENTFSMYNYEGDKIKTSKEFKNILMIVKDYAVVIDNDEFLKVVDFDGNIKAKFKKINDNYLFDIESSGLFFKENNMILEIFAKNISENKTTKFIYIPKTKEKNIVDL